MNLFGGRSEEIFEDVAGLGVVNERESRFSCADCTNNFKFALDELKKCKRELL